MDWGEFKTVSETFAISKDALHIYAAFVIQAAAAAVLRRPFGSIWPWLAVLVAEAINEYLDIRYSNETSLQAWQIAEAQHDIINTMLLPSALLLLCRYRAKLFCSTSPGG
jgi:hypothetical protein